MHCIGNCAVQVPQVPDEHVWVPPPHWDAQSRVMPSVVPSQSSSMPLHVSVGFTGQAATHMLVIVHVA